MAEQQNFSDGSRAERPGPFTFWTVRIGPESSTAAAFCRDQNRTLQRLIDAGVQPYADHFHADREGLT